MFPEANNNLKLLINNTPINTIIFDFDGTLAKLNIDFYRMRREILELVLSYGIKESDLPAEYVLETISYSSLKKPFFLKSVGWDHTKICTVHIRTDKYGRMIKISPKQSLEKMQKESSEELFQVKTTPGQNRIHPVAVFPFKMIPFQPMI